MPGCPYPECRLRGRFSLGRVDSADLAGRGCPGRPAFDQETEQDQCNGRHVGHDLIAKSLVSRVEPDGEGAEQGQQPSDSTALVHEEQHDASGSEEPNQRVQVAKIGRALVGHQW